MAFSFAPSILGTVARMDGVALSLKAAQAATHVAKVRAQPTVDHDAREEAGGQRRNG